MGLSRVQEGEEDYDNELREIDIQMGNSLELKERVCTLLCTFLNLEKENKSTVDYTYSDIIKRVSRSKQKEKDEIISKFTKMDSEERKVEDMMKNFRIGRWNVGQQKGLFAYNPDTYDRERDEMLTRVLNDMGEGTLDIVDEDLMEIYNLDELSKRQQDQAEIEEMNELLNGLGNNFMDGEYYEEDQLDAEDYF
jgi:phosphopentomutase